MDGRQKQSAVGGRPWRSFSNVIEPWVGLVITEGSKLLVANFRVDGGRWTGEGPSRILVGGGSGLRATNVLASFFGDLR